MTTATEPLYAIYINGEFSGTLLREIEADAFVKSFNRSSKTSTAHGKLVPQTLLAELVSKL